MASWRWREGLLALIVALLYLATDPLAMGDPMANAQALLRAERGVGLAFEPAVQAWAGDVPGLVAASAWYYLPGHFVPFFAVLAVLLRRGGADYAAFRHAALVAILVGFACFVLFPVAPPPSVPGSGLVDPVTSAPGLSSPGVAPLVNHDAAFPSEHVAWAVVVAWALVRLLGRAWLAFAVPHLAFTLLLVVVTGHHFIVDVLAGLAVGALGAAAGELRLHRAPVAATVADRRSA